MRQNWYYQFFEAVWTKFAKCLGVVSKSPCCLKKEEIESWEREMRYGDVLTLVAKLQALAWIGKRGVDVWIEAWEMRLNVRCSAMTMLPRAFTHLMPRKPVLSSGHVQYPAFSWMSWWSVVEVFHNRYFASLWPKVRTFQAVELRSHLLAT